MLALGGSIGIALAILAVSFLWLWHLRLSLFSPSRTLNTKDCFGIISLTLLSKLFMWEANIRSTAPPTSTASNIANPVKHQPIPIFDVSEGITTAAIAAPGFLSMFPRANAPAACWGTHSDKKAVVATNTQLIPKPAMCHDISI